MSQEIDSNDSWAADEVFGIAELREEILKYVMYDNEGSICGKMVGNARRVQKLWFETITKLLRKSKEPLIELTLDEDTNEVNIKQLVKTFGAAPRLQESFLPVKLDCEFTFFRERNYQSLSDCLTRLGNDVVEIQMNYPRDGGTMPVIFPPFNLPKLRKLSFEFSELELAKDDRDDEDVFGDNRNGLALLQSILNTSNVIRDLIIPVAGNVNVVPVGFKFLQLPTTISYLDISIELKNKDLEFLLRNQLPNLSHLTLMVHGVPFQDGLLFKMLEHFQNSLKSLKIDGFPSQGGPIPHSHMRFPLMLKLKKIEINCMECELGPGYVSALQEILPELTVVKLMRQPEDQLVKWTKGSRFVNVEELSVSVVNELLDYDEKDYYMSLGPRTIAQLRQSFPSVGSLSLAVNINDLTSLKYLFQEMVQLKTLTISFWGDKAVLDVSSDLIDATLLGLTLALVVALKQCMQMLDTGKIIITDGGEPSIRNLSELRTLTLETEVQMVSDGDHGGNRASLISNLLFREAFMKMTTLRNLDLYGKFKPSLEMENEWKGQGRSIEYSL